jgi:hypothetical protein
MNIITGMHRSGTSLIANLLFSLGMDFGSTDLLLKANRWNTKGYFENRHIVDLNNRLIVGNWDSIDYWIAANEHNNLTKKVMWNLGKLRYLKLPSQKEISKRAAKLQLDIKQLSSAFENKIVKDVRFSLTVSDWVKYGKVNNIIYCYRHPTDVAMSLKKRDGLPMFITYKLWVEHVERFFRNIVGQKVILVNYDNFFKESTQGEELLRVLYFANILPHQAKMEEIVNRVLDTTMRHNACTDARLPRYVQDWYQQLHAYHSSYKNVQVFEEANVV